MSPSDVGVPERKNFKNVKVRMSIRFKYVLFPFHTVELVDTLTKSGYAPTTPPPPMATPGIRFGITGTIARKGEITIDINDDRGVLAASAPSSTLAIEGLNEVIQLIKSHHKVDLDELASFYEFIGQLEVETDRNAIESIGRVINGNEIIEELGNIVGGDVSIFTLRLAPTGQVPNQTEWFDITIEPDVIKTSLYNVRAVFRSRDKSKVQKFTEEFIPKVSEMIDSIERPKN